MPFTVYNRCFEGQQNSLKVKCREILLYTLVFSTKDSHFGAGKVVALDINKGRLRMLTEAAQQQGVGDVVISCHDDLRDYAVCKSFCVF